MSKYKSKGYKLNFDLMRKLKVYSEWYLNAIEKYPKLKDNSLLVKKLYKSI